MSRGDEYLTYDRVLKIKKAWEIILDNIFHAEYSDTRWREDQNLRDTPERIARSMINERCEGIGCENKCKELLQEQFPTLYDGMVSIGPLTVYSLCPHHFESIEYSVYFGYIPKHGKVVGLSKPGRVIKLFAKQPIIQEEYTRKLANMFMDNLKPEGVGLIVKGKHTCMSARGLEQPDTYTTTSEMRGWFRDKSYIKDEFMRLCEE